MKHIIFLITFFLAGCDDTYPNIKVIYPKAVDFESQEIMDKLGVIRIEIVDGEEHLHANYLAQGFDYHRDGIDQLKMWYIGNKKGVEARVKVNTIYHRPDPFTNTIFAYSSDTVNGGFK